MIKFKSYLNEVMQSKGIDSDIIDRIEKGNLYHTTNPEAAFSILDKNVFIPSGGNIGKKGLSTTFDENYEYGSGGVKFTLDFNLLDDDYELIFVDEDIGHLGDESEVKVLSEDPIPALKYIKEISIEDKGNKDLIRLTKSLQIKIS